MKYSRTEEYSLNNLKGLIHYSKSEKFEIKCLKCGSNNCDITIHNYHIEIHCKQCKEYEVG